MNQVIKPHSYAHEEYGFSLIEIIIVLTLIAIVMSIAVLATTSTKRNSAITKGRATARSLGEAIEQFQRDHGGRLPVQPTDAKTPPDWNSPPTSPIDSSNGDKPYLKGAITEAISDGVVAFENTPAATNAPVRLRYVDSLGGASTGEYGITLLAKKNFDYVEQCYVSNSTNKTAIAAALGVDREC